MSLRASDDQGQFTGVDRADLPKKFVLAKPGPSFRLEPVVRATAQLQVGRVGFAAVGKRNHMVKLEESSLRTSALAADERALPSVASPHVTLYRRSHVASGVRGAMA